MIRQPIKPIKGFPHVRVLEAPEEVVPPPSELGKVFFDLESDLPLREICEAATAGLTLSDSVNVPFPEQLGGEAIQDGAHYRLTCPFLGGEASAKAVRYLLGYRPKTPKEPAYQDHPQVTAVVGLLRAYMAHFGYAVDLEFTERKIKKTISPEYCYGGSIDLCLKKAGGSRLVVEMKAHDIPRGYWEGVADPEDRFRVRARQFQVADYRELLPGPVEPHTLLVLVGKGFVELVHMQCSDATWGHAGFSLADLVRGMRAKEIKAIRNYGCVACPHTGQGRGGIELHHGTAVCKRLRGDE